MKNTQSEKADLLRALHHNGEIFIFPNIRDNAGTLLFANGDQDDEMIPYKLPGSNI